MKFCGEVQRLHSSALQIHREGVQFASDVGQVRVAYGGNNESAALRAHFQPAEFRGGTPKGIVGSIEIVDDARVSRIVEPVGAEKQVEVAQRLTDVVQP